MRILSVAGAAVIILWAGAAFAGAAADPGGAPPGAVEKTYKGMDAVRLLMSQGDWQGAIRFCYAVIWSEINKAECLDLLGQCLEKTRRPEEAAVFYTILLRVLDEDKASSGLPEAKKWRSHAGERLKVLDAKFLEERKKHMDSAAGRRFPGAEAVEDRWMTNVKVTLASLHGLYAWKLVGGRKDVRADWIHNTQGEMHRSGAKLCAEVDGRKGVLFCVPSRKSSRDSRLVTTNVGGCKVLRVGIKAYGFPFTLNVLAGGKTLLTKTIGKDSWEDLAVSLGGGVAGGESSAAAAGSEVVLEFVIPEDQKWSEGLWLDYVDFFED
jgi:hypothetical protein